MAGQELPPLSGRHTSERVTAIGHPITGMKRASPEFSIACMLTTSFPNELQASIASAFSAQ
jgi:hypothetical protein